MSTEIIPEVFTADYTGEPGQRTFFLQARAQQSISTYLVEKQQVSILAEKLREILVLVDQTDTVLSTTPERDPAFGLEAPLEPDWRIGAIGLGYDESSDRVIVSMQPEEQGEEPIEPPIEPPQPEDFAVRYLLRRDQVRAFVLHALAVVGEGRPLCQLCGLPIDPSGHACPASNGHRAGAEF